MIWSPITRRSRSASGYPPNSELQSGFCSRGGLGDEDRLAPRDAFQLRQYGDRKSRTGRSAALIIFAHTCARARGAREAEPSDAPPPPIYF